MVKSAGRRETEASNGLSYCLLPPSAFASSLSPSLSLTRTLPLLYWELPHTVPLFHLLVRCPASLVRVATYPQTRVKPKKHRTENKSKSKNNVKKRQEKKEKEHGPHF